MTVKFIITAQIQHLFIEFMHIYACESLHITGSSKVNVVTSQVTALKNMSTVNKEMYWLA